MICVDTDIREVVAIIDKADLMITIDSGPMHIASAVQTPIVALFGPTQEEVYGPYSLTEKHRIIRGNAGCAPCYKTREFVDCENRIADCMLSIKEEDVLKAAMELLDERKID